jgi:hypothetical protein
MHKDLTRIFAGDPPTIGMEILRGSADMKAPRQVRWGDPGTFASPVGHMNPPTSTALRNVTCHGTYIYPEDLYSNVFRQVK